MEHNAILFKNVKRPQNSPAHNKKTIPTTKQNPPANVQFHQTKSKTQKILKANPEDLLLRNLFIVWKLESKISPEKFNDIKRKQNFLL